MSLEQARKMYHNYHKIGNTVYFVFHSSQGYNVHRYSVMRIFGQAPSEEDFIHGFRGNEWCGGIRYGTLGKKQSDYDFGEQFSFEVAGCD